MRLLAIVPAYNEAENLPHVLEGLAKVPGLDVCVVDDGSQDDTARVAASLGATVLRLPVNLGIGGAVQTGFRWALARGYDVAVQVDGDDQHDPAQLPALLEPLTAGRADYVVGSRFLGEKSGFRSTAVRRAGIRYLCALLRLRAGVHVTDPTSGFRAANRKAIELFARHYPSDYPEPEAVALAARSGLRLVEVPVQMRPRRHGQSSIGAAGTAYYFAKLSVAILLLPAREPPGHDDGS
ncbi:MAG: glycosyltransferase family 2 protein [Myxococcales bacterium]